MNEYELSKTQKKVLILCWIAYACIYIARSNLSISIPELQRDLGWSKTRIGLLGSCFFWIYGTGQMINGYVGDRISSKLFILIGLLVTGLSNLIFGLSTSFIIMLISWAMNGYFQSMLWGPIVRIISDYFPKHFRNTAITTVNTSMVGGYLIAFVSLSIVMSMISWRAVFIIPGIFIIGFAILWSFLIENNPTTKIEDEKDQELVSERNQVNKISFFRIIVETKLWIIIIVCFAQGILKDGIGLWAPTFLMESYNVDIKSAVWFLIFMTVMNFFGVIFGGWVNKKVHYQENLAIMILFGISIVAVISFVKVSNDIYIKVFFLSLVSSAAYAANSLLLGMVPLNYLKYNKVSTVAGFLNFSSYLSTGLSTIFTGSIIDNFGWNGVIVLWIIACSLAGIFSLLSWVSSKNISKVREI